MWKSPGKVPVEEEELAQRWKVEKERRLSSLLGCMPASTAPVMDAKLRKQLTFCSGHVSLLPASLQDLNTETKSGPPIATSAAAYPAAFMRTARIAQASIGASPSTDQFVTVNSNVPNIGWPSEDSPRQSTV